MKKMKKKKHRMKRWAIVTIIVAVLLILEILVLRRGWATERKPVFYSGSLEDVKLTKGFMPGEQYITNKVTGLNRYYIDENSVLWGYGRNEYGQLGNGEVTEEPVGDKEPVWIAENIVSVDCSVNGYFCIFLTEDGELYGMGSNMKGMLDADEEKDEVHPTGGHRQGKITRPVLLMDEVRYARAGRESITALKEDGSVWWWGRYQSTYQTSADQQDEKKKMTSDSPRKLLDHCIYATTGDWTGAAITKEGELYTWGLNIFGECGTKVTGDDYVREPRMVLENVRMVWPEKMERNSAAKEIPDVMEYHTTYHFNTFVQLKDGTLLAAGKDLGTKDKSISITGDLYRKTTHTYSDTFVPIKAEAYSMEQIEEWISQLEIGMTREEVETYLKNKGLRYEYGYTMNEYGEYKVKLKEIHVLDSKFLLYFDTGGELVKIWEQ